MIKIKNDGFFAGFIEIYAISIIYNRPIVILVKISYLTNYYFYKTALFNINEKENINIDDIIFIQLINKNHYQMLNTNINFIKDRINKLITPYYNLIYINKTNNKMIYLENYKIDSDKEDNVLDLCFNNNKLENKNNDIK